jgi:hypothetical protein
MRKQAPRAATLEQVEDGVDDLAGVSCIFGRPVALGAGRWDLRQDDSTSERSVGYGVLMVGNLPSYPFKPPFRTVS